MVDSVEFNDFSGGITDYIEKPSRGNQCEIADNLLISNDRSLICRPGLVCWNNDHPVIEDELSQAQSVLGIYELEGYLIAFCEDRYFYYTKIDMTSGWTRIQGPVDDNPVSPYECKLTVTRWNGHLIISVDPIDKDASVYFPDPVVDPPEYKRVPPRKIFIEANRSLTLPYELKGVPVIRTLQLPLPKNINVIDDGSGSFNYSYKIGFCYRYYALVNNEIVEFLDVGPYELYQAIESAAISGSNKVTIEWDKIKNDSFGYNSGGSFTDVELWDTANIRMYFARTEANSEIFYELTNGLFSITSDQNESTPDPDVGDYDDGNVDGATGIASYPPAYDQDGSLMVQPLTQGPYFHTIVGDVTWYLNDLQGQTRIYQSFSGNPSSTNPSLFTSIDEPGTGITHFNGNPLAFSLESSYRIDGVYDEFGGGRLIAKLISDRYGCISHYSIVRTEIGVFFFSQRGVCYSNGISAIRISRHLDKSYQRWTATEAQIQKIYGIYHKTDHKVYWRIEDADESLFFLVLDLNFAISEEASFTKVKFSSSLNIGPAFVGSEDKRLLFAADAYVLAIDPEARDDVIPDTGLAAYWKTSPIMWEFKSVAINMGSSLSRKRSPYVIFNCRDSEDLQGVSCRPLGYNDLESNPRYLDPCFFFQNMSAYGVKVGLEYGSSDPVWDNSQIVPFRRHFHGDSVRYLYKQFGLKNLPIALYFSADYEQGIYTETVGLITLTLPNTTSLPTNDYDDTSWYLYTSLDDYEVPIPVESISVTTETVISLRTNSEVSSGTLTINDVGWKLAQIRKSEKFNLLAFGLPYEVIGQLTHGNYVVGGGSNNGN